MIRLEDDCTGARAGGRYVKKRSATVVADAGNMAAEGGGEVFRREVQGGDARILPRDGRGVQRRSQHTRVGNRQRSGAERHEHGAVWGFIDELSRIIKSVDDKHLTSTVIAHNKSALDSIARYAPSLDVVGINSYGPILQVKDMVSASDYDGPYMITEWGPTGWWETSSTEWKAPIEQTSEQKRRVYETRYNEAILGDPRCIGSFVFLWDRKRSARLLGSACSWRTVSRVCR